jgi:small redox-active disulfide protein 2
MLKIQILGTGCTKCNKLADNAKEAAEALGEAVEIAKVTNLNDIMTFGCMTTPGLAINGQLVSQGKLLKPDQIMKLIKPAAGES